MSNLAEIKRTLGVETINFNVVTTEANEVTDWLKDWDNGNRVAILIHKDTLAKIKSNPTISTLGIHTQTKQGPQGQYVAKTIVVYTPADETL